jgi:hypothetical protein
VQDEQFGHALPEGVGDLLLITHISIIDIYRLGLGKNFVAFTLVYDYFYLCDLWLFY